MIKCSSIFSLWFSSEAVELYVFRLLNRANHLRSISLAKYVFGIKSIVYSPANKWKIDFQILIQSKIDREKNTESKVQQHTDSTLSCASIVVCHSFAPAQTDYYVKSIKLRGRVRKLNRRMKISFGSGITRWLVPLHITSHTRQISRANVYFHVLCDIWLFGYVLHYIHQTKNKS